MAAGLKAPRQHGDTWSRRRRFEVGLTQRHRSSSSSSELASALLPPPPAHQHCRFDSRTHATPVKEQHRRPPGRRARATPTMKLPWLLALAALLAPAATVSKAKPPRMFSLCSGRPEPRGAAGARCFSFTSGLYYKCGFFYLFIILIFFLGALFLLLPCTHTRACSAGVFSFHRDADVCDRWEILHSTYLSSLYWPSVTPARGASDSRALFLRTRTHTHTSLCVSVACPPPVLFLFYHALHSFRAVCARVCN